MSVLLKAGLLFILSWQLFSCSQPSPVHRHTVLVFGTLVEINITGVDSNTADNAFLEVEQQLHDMHANWTPWQDSDLTRVNDAIKRGEAFDMPDSLARLVQESIQHHRDSEGMFDPAVGQLIKLWQFHRHEDPELMPPGPSMIHAWLEHSPSIDDLQQQQQQWRSDNPNVDLNFGAFAKGIAVEQVLQYLRSENINNAIVNAGGDLAAIGENTAEQPARPWNIGIRHPRNDGLLASIAVQNGEAVFTSGDYERFYIREGTRYHHILDPRTGYPTEGTSSVTVIDNDAGKADAAATALMVAGIQHWHRIARNMGIRYAMLMDAEGVVHMNPAMAERVRFEVSPKPRIVLSDTL